MATPPSDVRSRWVAVVTGALSILIAVIYLLLVTWLDRQGPLLLDCPPELPPHLLLASPLPYELIPTDPDQASVGGGNDFCYPENEE